MDALTLDVADWAAILHLDSALRFGAAEAPDAIPARHRRRLPRFSSDIVCCALPLLRVAPESAVVLSAPHGDLASTVALLIDVARRDLLSPTQFSLSVHNAPAGVLSLCSDVRADHVAIAAGPASLAAGLTEAYARLASGEGAEIILVHADDRFPDIYAPLDEAAPGLFVAMRLRLRTEGDIPRAEPGLGRTGAERMIVSLEKGARRIVFTPPDVAACAA